MTPEKWDEIKQKISKSFKIEEEGVEDLMAQTGEGEVKQGTAEYIVFRHPSGRMKVRFEEKPRLEEKKFHYSHRSGDAARVEYKFSEEEKVYALRLFRWRSDEESWEELSAEGLF